jgi:hypothetical protein
MGATAKRKSRHTQRKRDLRRYSVPVPCYTLMSPPPPEKKVILCLFLIIKNQEATSAAACLVLLQLLLGPCFTLIRPKEHATWGETYPPPCVARCCP